VPTKQRVGYTSYLQLHRLYQVKRMLRSQDRSVMEFVSISVVGLSIVTPYHSQSVDYVFQRIVGLPYTNFWWKVCS